MLIRSSGPLHVDFFLMTFGPSCHYAVSDESSFVLFDPGLSAHAPFLAQRLSESGLPLEELQLIFLTHLHPDRIGGVPLLKKLAPHVKVAGSPLMRTMLSNEETVREIYNLDTQLSASFDLPGEKREPMTFEEYRSLMTVDKLVVDSDVTRLASEISVRAVNFPGHSQESMAYLIQPYRYLLADEGLGYYNGRKLAAPGGDFSMTQNLESLAKFNDLDIAGLCCTNTGVITGNLVRKHIHAIAQNTSDLRTECRSAHASGISDEDIRFSIRDAFYNIESRDPILRWSYDRSFEAIWRQILEERLAPTPEAEEPTAAGSDETIEAE